jgi:hypothetical protein
MEAFPSWKTLLAASLACKDPISLNRPQSGRVMRLFHARDIARTLQVGWAAAYWVDFDWTTIAVLRATDRMRCWRLSLLEGVWFGPKQNAVDRL